MIDSSSELVLWSINQRIRAKSLAGRVWAVGSSLGALAAILALNAGYSLLPTVLVLAVAPVGLGSALAAAIRLKSRRAKDTLLVYHVDDRAECGFSAINAALGALSKSEMVWQVGRTRKTSGPRPGEPGAMMERSPVRVGLIQAPYLRSNVRVLGIETASSKLFFFPDSVFIYQSGRYQSVKYESIRVSAAATKFIERGSFPRDAVIWNTNRQADNRDKTTTLLYGLIELTDDRGLSLNMLVSNKALAYEFATAFGFDRKGVDSESRGFESEPTSHPFDGDPATRHFHQPCVKGPNERWRYDVLGLKEDATQDEIIKAYREKARAFHPDRFAELGPDIRGFAEEKMRDINAAYTSLKTGFSPKAAPPQNRAAGAEPGPAPEGRVRRFASIADLLPDEFVKQHTRFDSLLRFLRECDVVLRPDGAVAPEASAKLDFFVKQNSEFDTWDQMRLQGFKEFCERTHLSASTF